MEEYSDHILNNMTEVEELAVDLYTQCLAGPGGDIKDKELFNDCLAASEHIIETLLKRHEVGSETSLKVVSIKKQKIDLT